MRLPAIFALARRRRGRDVGARRASIGGSERFVLAINAGIGHGGIEQRRLAVARGQDGRGGVDGRHGRL